MNTIRRIKELCISSLYKDKRSKLIDIQKTSGEGYRRLIDEVPETGFIYFDSYIGNTETDTLIKCCKKHESLEIYIGIKKNVVIEWHPIIKNSIHDMYCSELNVSVFFIVFKGELCIYITKSKCSNSCFRNVLKIIKK